MPRTRSPLLVVGCLSLIAFSVLLWLVPAPSGMVAEVLDGIRGLLMGVAAPSLLLFARRARSGARCRPAAGV